MGIDPNKVIELQHKLDKIKREHAAVEEEIGGLSSGAPSDDIKVYRLKKVKLFLKDQIMKIEEILTPNIIA